MHSQLKAMLDRNDSRGLLAIVRSHHFEKACDFFFENNQRDCIDENNVVEFFTLLGKGFTYLGIMPRKGVSDEVFERAYIPITGKSDLYHSFKRKKIQ